MKKTMQLTITHKGLYEQNIDKLPLKASFSVYKDIWKTLNESVIDSIIEGNTEKLSHSLGCIKVIRFKSSFKFNSKGHLKYNVNWGKTKKLRKEGKLDPDKFCYSILEYKCKYLFTKGIRKIKGYRAYTFKPSRTNGTTSKSGAINKLCDYLLENSINYLRFPLNK